MIKVYFQSETGSHSEVVAVFRTEKLYMEALPSLEKVATEQRCFVTESYIEDDFDDVVAEDGQAVGYSCLTWSFHDFYGDKSLMNQFFTTHQDSIIQYINELITLSKEN
jgi:hypothetical protein